MSITRRKFIKDGSVLAGTAAVASSFPLDLLAIFYLDDEIF